MVRIDAAAFDEVLVARIQHRGQHRLEKQEVAHPLADDDVHFRHRQLNVLQSTLDQRDHAVQLVVLDCTGEPASRAESRNEIENIQRERRDEVYTELWIRSRNIFSSLTCLGEIPIYSIHHSQVLKLLTQTD